MTRAVTNHRRRKSDHQHLVIRRSDLATAIHAGLQSWASVNGSGLHPGVRAEICAHLVAAIARVTAPDTTPPAAEVAPAATRWWDDPGEQSRGE